MSNELTTNQLCKATGLKPYTIDYLVRNDIITCIKNGKGRQRLFPQKVIDEIKIWKNGQQTFSKPFQNDYK